MTETEQLRKEIEILDRWLWARARKLSAQRIPYRFDNEYVAKSQEYDVKEALLCAMIKEMENDQ